MNPKQRFVALPVMLFVFSAGVANAGQTIKHVGSIVCVTDKWDEKEVDKGHKLIDYAGRCVDVPDDAAALKSAADCEGKYEYMADGSWKGNGTCTYTYKTGDKLTETWAEGSHLKESTYKITGGTGKYENAGGGGTYNLEELTDTLWVGRFGGTIELP